MTTKPLVSIVTPSFDQAKFLERTMQSVFAQTYSNLEYIVVDGGSRDHSKEIIEKYSSKLAWWVSEKDCGQTEAINKGFAHANGEILAWLNSDDTYQPNAVFEAVEFLQDNPEIGLVYGDANFIDENDRVVGRFPARQTDLAGLRRGYVHIPQQASFFRGDLWKKVGPLDESFFFAMDYDLWVRLAKTSQLKYYPRIWANFRLHEDAKTISADERCWPEMLRVHYRDGGSRLAPIVLKYWLRKFASPIINWRRRRLYRE
jgi:glycosyltransferase involved in cell wall biosynthesis